MSEGKSPWGQGPSGGDGGNGEGGNEGGPRNPWSMPPGGRKSRQGASSLDEFLKRTRGGGSGGNGGGNTPSGIPGGRNLWIVGAVGLIALYVIFSSFHSIGPQQRGVVSTFGRYSYLLSPGFRFTLPAPINTVKVVNVDKVRTDDFPQGKSENLVLTGDQNIVDLSYSVRWNIKSPVDYVFEVANPQETVRAAAESAMRATIANVTLDDAIGKGREDIEIEVQKRMQETLDRYKSGVNVLGIALKPVSPPAQVDDAFKAVTAAQQKAQADLNNARAYAQQVIARAQGDAVQFDKIYAQYKLAPTVTKRRLYYETMEEILARTNKTIIEPKNAVPYIAIPALKGQSKSSTPDATAPAGDGQ